MSLLPRPIGPHGASIGRAVATSPLARGIPQPKDGPVNAAYPTRPHGRLHGMPQHYAWWVSDSLARGDQPTDDDLRFLANNGFKSVINLRGESNEDESKCKALGLNYLHIDWTDQEAPTSEQMKQILDFATDPANGPVFVHCQAGRNRTSVMGACYAMAVEGRSLSDALAEATDWGLHTTAQVSFVKQFASDLQHGDVPGYPLQAGARSRYALSASPRSAPIDAFGA